MQTYLKKRIEILVEAPALHRLLDKLDSSGVTGYTVLPALAGKGRSGSWTEDGLVGDAGRVVAVLCITDAAKADLVLESIFGLLSRQIGIVNISDVAVIRSEHF
jgi:nitrogen regulatory protein PII